MEVSWFYWDEDGLGSSFRFRSTEHNIWREIEVPTREHLRDLIIDLRSCANYLEHQLEKAEENDCED